MNKWHCDKCNKESCIEKLSELFGWGLYFCDECCDKFIQSERSKREDSDNLGHDYIGIPTTEESWCRNCGEESHIIKLSKMRCSELYGNIERDK
jgi:hypothetical protein